MSALKIEIKMIIEGLVLLKDWVMMRIGAIFCKVDRIQHISHEIEFITVGSQKWQGAIPSFIRRAKINNVVQLIFCSGIDEDKMIIEASA